MTTTNDRKEGRLNVISKKKHFSLLLFMLPVTHLMLMTRKNNSFHIHVCARKLEIADSVGIFQNVFKKSCQKEQC